MSKQFNCVPPPDIFGMYLRVNEDMLIIDGHFDVDDARIIYEWLGKLLPREPDE